MLQQQQFSLFNIKPFNVKELSFPKILLISIYLADLSNGFFPLLNSNSGSNLRHSSIFQIATFNADLFRPVNSLNSAFYTYRVILFAQK